MLKYSVAITDLFQLSVLLFDLFLQWSNESTVMLCATSRSLHWIQFRLLTITNAFTNHHTLPLP